MPLCVKSHIVKSYQLGTPLIVTFACEYKTEPILSYNKCSLTMNASSDILHQLEVLSISLEPRKVIKMINYRFANYMC